MLVVTFYSFKGGVGRTTLATNIAMRLAEHEQRVLLVDFDLEAPGLSYMADLRPPANAERPRGVAGCLVDSWRARESADYRRYLYDLEGFPGRFAIMPAGAIDSPRFAEDLDALHHDEILNLSKPDDDAAAALTLLADLREQWASDFDYVLIDSRTGFSDIGGVCTRVLPDLVVTVLSLNSQGIDGTAQVLSQIGDESILGHPIRKLTAVSMVPIELAEQSTTALRAIAKTLNIRMAEIAVLPFFLPFLVHSQPFSTRSELKNDDDEQTTKLVSPLMIAYDSVLDEIRRDNLDDIEYRLDQARARVTLNKEKGLLSQLLEELSQNPNDLPITRVARALRLGAESLASASDRRRGWSTDDELAIRSLRVAVSLFTHPNRTAYPEEYQRTVRALEDALMSTARGTPDDETSLLQALELYQQAGNEAGAANVLEELGTSALTRRRFGDARQWLMQSLEIRSQKHDAPDLGGTYHYLGVAAEGLREFDEAERWYHQALDVWEALGALRDQTTTIRQLGVVAQERRQYDAAEKWYLRSLEIEEEIDDAYGQGVSLHQLGMVAQERRQFGEAEHWYYRSLGVKEKIGDRLGQGASLHQLGVLAQEQGRLEQAENWYRQALVIEEQIKDESGQADTLHQLGRVAHELQMYDLAEVWYQQALEIQSRIGDVPHQAITLHQLGRVSEDQLQLDDAELWYRQSLLIAGGIGDEYGQSITLHQLGFLAEERMSLDEAERRYRESLSISERLGDESGQAGTLYQLGRVAEKNRKLPEAVELLRAAATLFERTNDSTNLRMVRESLARVQDLPKSNR